jgi:GTPase SAR1 family protein
MKYCQLVLGSAGTGKSTYCHVLQEHAATAGRTMRVGNLDPAAEAFRYSLTFDLRELISVDDVMEELGLGPNGALLYAMEYLGNNLEWLDEQLESFVDDDYLLLDCPGQIELYTHLPVMRRVADRLRAHGFNTAVVYACDATFVTDGAKLLSGCLAALSAMVLLELPHVNVLTKVDLLPAADKERLEELLSPGGSELAATLSRRMAPRFRALNGALGDLLDSYDMVSFLPLDASDEESIAHLLLHIDHAIQYGEDMEPKEPKEAEGGGEKEGEEEEDEGGREAAGVLGSFAPYAQMSRRGGDDY